MKSQIESDVDMSLMTTPQGMSLHTPHILNGTRNQDTQKDHVMTTASGMDTMANTMTPMHGDYQEKASIKLSQDQVHEWTER